MHMVISYNMIFLLVSKYLCLWSLQTLELAILVAFVFHKHMLLAIDISHV